MLSRRRGQRGTALIGVAIVVVIAGLLLAGVFAGLRTIDREAQENLTRQHMMQITNALSVYYQKHRRLPCPAEPDRAVSPEPFGAERGSGAGGDQPGSCSGSSAELIGIVPFLALGLAEADVRDGWRQFITYRVAGLLTLADPLSGGGPPPQVHDLCRVQCVWICPGLGSCAGGGPGGGGPGGGPPGGSPPGLAGGACGGVTGTNINPQKAVHCCAEPEAGFDVRDADGNTLVPDPASPTSYQNINSLAPPGSAGLTTELPEILAVVLLSHGPNGHGAFLGNGARFDAGDVRPFEQENADDDGIFIQTSTMQPDAGYFDDLLEWRTKQFLFSQVGGYRTGCEGAPLP